MSRIYQGGGADRRYEGRARGASYQPSKVASNEKELRQQGQQVLQDLETQERERQRRESLEMAESATSAQVEALQLRAEQQAAASQFKFGQNAQRMALQRVQLGEEQLLKKTSLEGEQNLATQQRILKDKLERGLLTSSQTAKLNETKSRNQLATDQLRAQQRLGQDMLKGEQKLKKGQLKAAQDLQYGLTNLSQGLQKSQLAANQQLKRNELEAKNQLDLGLLTNKNQLDTLQTTERLGLEYQQTVERGDLQMSQLGMQQNLKFDFMQADFLLGSEARALGAQQAIDTRTQQAEFAVQNAEFSKMKAGVSALLSFADIAVGGAELVGEYQKQQEVKRLEEEKIQLQTAGYEWLFSPSASIVQPDGSVNPIITQEKALLASEEAYESGIQAASGQNPVTAELLRGPEADATMLRNIGQTDVNEASRRFSSDFNALISDPNFQVQMPDGSTRTLGTLRPGEERYFLESAAKSLTGAYGIDGKDAHALLRSYGNSVRATLQNAESEIGRNVRSAARAERYDAALSNAASYVQTGNVQHAWNVARSGAISSGQFMGQGPKAINDAVLKDLMSRLPPKQLAQLKQIQKISGNKGTTFGDDYYYNDMIDDEIRARRDEYSAESTSIQRYNNVAVKEIQNEVTEALYTANDGETALAIRQDGIARLEALGTPEALDAASKLAAQGSLNNNTYLDLVEGFDSGNPPSADQIASAFYGGEISQQQMNNLKNRGKTSDIIDQQIKAAGVQTPKQIAKGVVTEVLSNFRTLDAAERTTQAENIAVNLAPEVGQQLRTFVGNNPNATPGEIQKEVARIQGDIRDRLGIKPDEGLLKYDKDNGVQFEYRTTTVAPITTRANPVTGKVQRVYTQTEVRNIPDSASSTDVFLTRDEFRKELEVWQSGGQGYSARTRAIAQQLGISPQTFVLQQTRALGYDTIKEIPPAVINNPPTNLLTGFNAIQGMGFPKRGAAYLAGNIMQESSWNGQRSWGEVAGDGSDRNGGLVSWMDDAQRDHWRLRDIEQYLGKPIAQATPAEQLQAMVWEMKSKYQTSYRIFMNPNATDTQLRRASRAYWGYGHEGDRYSYARQLL